MQVGRVLKIGEAWGEGHVARVFSALRSRNALKPPLSGRLKDHKPFDPTLGCPPQRQVCGAVESNNGPLSEILSEVINKLADEMDDRLQMLAYSTEEMAAAVEGVNIKAASEDLSSMVTFSMDVKALYPSLVTKEVARLV